MFGSTFPKGGMGQQSSNTVDIFDFIEACRTGDLREAQHLYLLNPKMNISKHKDFAFRQACSNGHLQMAQWLLQICPTINISANNEQAFRYACIEGYLEVAKWLLQVCPNIHISAYNEEAFRWACVNGHLEVAKWLHQMKPYLYVIEYDENGKINNYHIRSKEEANWQKRKYLVWLASNECPDENKNNLLYKLPSDVSRMVIGFV
jgi:ankyrin repeat protein